MASRQAADHGPDLVARPPPDGGFDEAQRGGPALGRPGQVLEEVGLQRVAVGLPEEPLHLAAIEAQVGGRELGDLAEGPEPREGQRRRQPGRDHEGQSLGAAHEQLADDLADLGNVVHHLVVVQEESCADGHPGPDLGQERAHDRRPVAHPGPQLADERHGVGGELRVDLAPGRHDVVHEDHPVAVGLVEPVPERADPRPSAPVGQEGRLSVAGVGHDEHEPRVDLRGHPVEQALSLERLGGQERRLDLPDLDGEAEDVELAHRWGVRAWRGRR